MLGFGGDSKSNVENIVTIQAELYEAIHPFSDGNGRTGRIINIIYLARSGLLRLPVLYLSKYLIENKNKYYKLIRSVTEKGSWEEWVLFMLEGVEVTANETRLRISAIKELMEKAEQIAKDGGLVSAKRDTASSYLRELSEIGILENYKSGREVIYVSHELLKLLK